METQPLTNKAYHASEGIGSTQIRYYLQSPYKFKQSLEGGLDVEETDAMAFGTMAHEFILENQEKYVSDAEIVTQVLKLQPTLKNARASKNYKEMKAQVLDQGKIMVSPKVLDKLTTMRETLYANEKIKKALSLDFGTPEVSFFTEFNGRKYKARADFYGEKDGKSYVIDYKTTSGGDFKDIQRSIGKYGYDIQAAHYLKVIESATNLKPSHFFFLFQQKEAPYEFAFVRLGKRTLEAAKVKLDLTMLQIDQAFKDDSFPTQYGGGIVEMDSPDWRLNELSEAT